MLLFPRPPPLTLQTLSSNTSASLDATPLANCAEVCHRETYLTCPKTKYSISLTRDAPTSSRPTSPKCKQAACFNALEMSLLGIGYGNSVVVVRHEWVIDVFMIPVGIGCVREDKKLIVAVGASAAHR